MKIEVFEEWLDLKDILEEGYSSPIIIFSGKNWQWEIKVENGELFIHKWYNENENEYGSRNVAYGLKEVLLDCGNEREVIEACMDYLNIG